MKTTDILKPLKLRSGAGGSFENGLCVMEAVSWLGGEECTDRPQCACPVLGQFAINLNDILNNENRQNLLPLAFDMLGSNSKEHEKIRAEFLVIEVAKRIVSKAFDEIKLPEIAERYRNVETIADVKEVSIEAKKQSKAADAAAYAAAAAATYASAAAAAYAAAAADADAAAAAAAAAYADAAAAAAARQEVLLDCIPILQEAISLGPNGKIDDDVKSRAVGLSKFVRETLNA